MVVGITVVGLQQEMIGIGDRERRADSVQAHRLQFKRTQRPRGVVQQDLVDPQGDLASWLQVATGQMATDQLPGQVVSHGRTAFHDRVSTRIGEFNQENRLRAAALKAMLTDREAGTQKTLAIRVRSPFLTAS